MVALSRTVLLLKQINYQTFSKIFYHHVSLIKINSGALAREARSGAPWVKECGKLPIRENLVIT